MDTPLRWVQRLNNYAKALQQLEAAVRLAGQRELSEIEQQGLIKAFEFCFELAWNVMKDYFVFQGHSNITGSRDAIREAFSVGLIDQGELWMAMLKSRNLSAHTYNQAVANAIARSVTAQYYPRLAAFLQQMHQRSPCA